MRTVNTTNRVTADEVGDYLHQLLPQVKEQDLPVLVFIAHSQWRQSHNGEPLLLDARAYQENGRTRLVALHDTRMKPDMDFLPEEVVRFLERFAEQYRSEVAA